MQLHSSALKTKQTHQPCDNPECGSSDALVINEDGSTKCFSCGKFTPSRSTGNMSANFTRQIIGVRSIPEAVLRKYGAVCRVDEQGEPFALELPYNGHFLKVKDLKQKKFWGEGDSKAAGLFGQERFAAGSTSDIVLCEGETDAMAANAMLGLPAVSVRSASSAATDCASAFKYLDSFDNIYICFDNDPPGQQAVTQVAKLFRPNKVYHVKLTHHKDANEYLQEGKQKEFRSLWQNSRLYLPDGIIGSFAEVNDILNREGSAVIGEFPFPTLNGASLGIRGSEVVLITAQEGIGKTEIIRAIEHHLLKTTEHNIGIIHLEEQDKRTIQGLIGYELEQPIHLPECPVTTSDQLDAYKALTGKDGRVFLYPRFGSDDPNVILDTIRYLVAVCGCKFVFLDHITMLVTGFEGDDERRKLDYLSTRLAMLVNELDFSLVLVSHVNDDGKTRGSRNISKIAHLVLALSRNTESGSVEERNTTHLMIKKNRYGATTGPAGQLLFDPGTFMVREKTPEEEIDTEVGF